MAKLNLYKRMLPSPPAIEFFSDEGKQLFLEAFQCGTMESYFKLTSQFKTQPELGFCGLTSLVMILNALSIDPGRQWKGPWRWFDEYMLDCCEPLEKVKTQGISFENLVDTAQRAGVGVEAYLANQCTIEDFRRYVVNCCSSDDCYIILAFQRAALKQTGSGHYSPVGGYHGERDMVFILDTARFKYPPYWVPLTLVWEAMNQENKLTRGPRGFMLISRSDRSPEWRDTLDSVQMNGHGQK